MDRLSIILVIIVALFAFPYIFSHLFSKNISQALASGTSSHTGPVVLELFTSQSCSSCPPADRLLREFSMQEDVITLSCHVTYWNHLHWKDTLSQEFCTQRQRAYASQTGKARVYTPQLIINGRNDYVGSRKGQIERAIAEAKRQSRLSTIGISKTEEGYAINLPELENNSGETYTLLAFHYIQSHRQDIRSGENRGALVDYTHPVTALNVIGGWAGHKQTQTLSLQSPENSDGLVILAQNIRDGSLIAAGQIIF